MQTIHQRIAAAKAAYEAAVAALGTFEQGLGRPQLAEQLERDFDAAAGDYAAVLSEYVGAQQ